MDKKVKIFKSFEQENRSDDQYYLSIKPEKGLELLLNLINYGAHNDGIVERSVRVYPLTESKES
jgi:hypothetical protein